MNIYHQYAFYMLSNPILPDLVPAFLLERNYYCLVMVLSLFRMGISFVYLYFE